MGAVRLRSAKISFDDDKVEDARAGNTLSLIADAFEKLSDSVKKGNKKDASFELDLKSLCE
ncbi:hypothetical protein R6Q59_004742, partial [Mikania micrantha]